MTRTKRKGRQGVAHDSATFSREERGDERCPIVALGASAGGLAALESFLSSMSADSGMAFVIVTHLPAKITSHMAEILGRRTAMPVMEIRTATAARPNHVYTVRPGYDLSILNGVLQPMEPEPAPLRMPVDYFLRSLARDQGERAIAIILSGTGSDGSVGIRAIKQELGMVMAQSDAEHSGMPRSANVTDLVDYFVPLAEIATQLLGYAEARRDLVAKCGPPSEVAPDTLHQILVLIRDHTGHDFSHYKKNTISRRVVRRIRVHRLESEARYVRYLQVMPTEVELLFKERRWRRCATPRDCSQHR